MRLAAILSSTLILAIVSPAAQAAEVSREISAKGTASEVWALIGPFCAIADWYPGIETCAEETIDGMPHRRLTTADGAVFLEKLLAHDDAAMSYSYAIIEGPLPVSDYSSDVSVTDSDGKAVVVWKSTFEPAGASEEEAVKVVTSVYDTGLEAIRAHFAK